MDESQVPLLAKIGGGVHQAGTCASGWQASIREYASACVGQSKGLYASGTTGSKAIGQAVDDQQA